jgi:hypothetical protein
MFMALNMVTTILNMVPQAVLDKLAAALGVNSGLVKTALAAAVPAVLGSLGSKASTETGARALFDAVNKTDTSMMGDLVSSLTGASGQKFLQGGLGTLGSLLGDNTMKGLTGAIAKQAGIGSDASSSLIGFASQLAMGQLAKSAASGGLNASSLAGLLSSQQGNIAAALPAGLGTMLSSAGILGNDYLKASAAPAQAAARTTSQPAHAAKSSSGWLRWLIPLLIALGAIWYFLGSGTETAVKDAAINSSSIVVDGVDVNSQLNSVFDSLKTTLGGITDGATAQTALPKLEEAVKSVDNVSAVFSKLTPEQRTVVAGIVGAALPTLKDLIAKVLAIPGVGDIAKPTLDSLVAKVEALSKA